MKNVLFVTLAFCTVFILACSKKKEDPKPPTPTELLTRTTWKINAIGYDDDKNGEIDTPIPLVACDADNTISFSSNGSGVFDFGPLKCSDSETLPIDFNWSFKENNALINIDGMLPGGLTGDVNVLTLTETTFAFSRPVTVPRSTNIIVINKAIN
ncbi:MAG: lipocalin family protein [Chitinophagaceae bacterium]|nr:lipocalin family protein [Chitinophagaceae bacterium]